MCYSILMDTIIAPAKIRFRDKEYKCAIEVALDLIGGKWKALILCHLATGTLRYNELKKAFPCITQKMLTQQLRDLEEDGLIHRKIYPQVPPKVEYSLTEFGESLMPVIRVMNDWGRRYLEKMGTPAICCGVTAACLCSETESG